MTREVAIEGLKAFRREFSGYEPNEEMFDMAIKALEQEPTTKNCRTCRNFGSHHGICEICKDYKCWTEQEPQSFKWCTDCKEYNQEKHCCHRYSKVIRDAVSGIEQEPVLDKIRAELIQSIQNGTLKIESGNEELFRIIDKYKAEVEPQESEVSE